MTQLRRLLISRAQAHLVLGRLKFMTAAGVMLETFEASHERQFNAPAWALAATDLVRQLEAGCPVDMDRTNTVILVEALEGTTLQSMGWPEVAAQLAQRLETYMGRVIVLDKIGAQD